MSKAREALDTILHHLSQGLSVSSREELRVAFDDLAEWCDEMNEAKRVAERTAYEASVRANGGIPD